MENNLPILAKRETIFKKMTNFIKRIFKIERKSKINSKKKEKAKYKNKINELYKAAVANNYKITNDAARKERLNEIIKTIERQPELLEKLDVSKLEVIDNYYKTEILKYKERIRKVS